MSSNRFFEQPILNSPYEYPDQHWELDESGQPTQQIVEQRRKADFVTPIPRAKSQKSNGQQAFSFGEVLGTDGGDQKYDPTSRINALRNQVDKWRSLPEDKWRVTPETARLLKHWRSKEDREWRPFFCQREAVETAIWLTD